VPEAADLQSTGVTNFPTHPNYIKIKGPKPLYKGFIFVLLNNLFENIYPKIGGE